MVAWPGLALVCLAISIKEVMRPVVNPDLGASTPVSIYAVAPTPRDLGRVRRYYSQRGVPFDSERGFEERLAFQANRTWANRFAVKRIHNYQFRMSFRQLQRGPVRRVEGW